MLPVLLTVPPYGTESPAATGPVGQFSVTLMAGVVTIWHVAEAEFVIDRPVMASSAVTVNMSDAEQVSRATI